MKLKINNLHFDDKAAANVFLDLLDFFINDISIDYNVSVYMKGENECQWKIDFK